MTMLVILLKTFSLLWPSDNSKKLKTFTLLGSFMSNLVKQKNKDDLIVFLKNYFDTSLPNEIYTIIKILLRRLKSRRI